MIVSCIQLGSQVWKLKKAFILAQEGVNHTTENEFYPDSLTVGVDFHFFCLSARIKGRPWQNMQFQN